MSDRIAERIQQSMDSMVFSESEKKRICMQLQNRAAQEERMSTMKRTVKTRRIIAIAAVFVMVMGISAFAAGKITQIFSHGHAGYDFKTEEQLAKVTQRNDLIALPEGFSNGFQLKGGNQEMVKGADEDGNTVSAWTEVSADYTLSGKVVSISESRMPRDELGDAKETADETRILNGTEVSYRYIDFMFVPPDYKPDEETAAREKEDPHFTISYGSDSVTTQRGDFVTWEKDGITITIMSFDGVSREDLFAIAEELIQG